MASEPTRCGTHMRLGFASANTASPSTIGVDVVRAAVPLRLVIRTRAVYVGATTDSTSLSAMLPDVITACTIALISVVRTAAIPIGEGTGRGWSGNRARSTAINVASLPASRLHIGTVRTVPLSFVSGTVERVNICAPRCWTRCRTATDAALVRGLVPVAEGICPVVLELRGTVASQTHAELVELWIEHVPAVVVGLLQQLNRCLRRAAAARDVLPAATVCREALGVGSCARGAPILLVSDEILGGHALRPLACCPCEPAVPLELAPVRWEVRTVW